MNNKTCQEQFREGKPGFLTSHFKSFPAYRGKANLVLHRVFLGKTATFEIVPGRLPVHRKKSFMKKFARELVNGLEAFSDFFSLQIPLVFLRFGQSNIGLFG